MRPILVPFVAEHLSDFKFREDVDMEALIKTAVMVENRGPAFTGVCGGRVLGCGGIVPLWSGVGEAWSVFSDEISGHGFWLHRTVKRFIRDAMLGMDLGRLQISVRTDSERNIKWAEKLGFHNEGRMPRYGHDGSDHFRFGLLGGG